MAITILLTCDSRGIGYKPRMALSFSHNPTLSCEIFELEHPKGKKMVQDQGPDRWKMFSRIRLMFFYSVWCILLLLPRMHSLGCWSSHVTATGFEKGIIRSVNLWHPHLISFPPHPYNPGNTQACHFKRKYSINSNLLLFLHSL